MQRSRSLKLPNVFGTLRMDYAELNDRRKAFYETHNSKDGELRYRELQNITECMFQLYVTEPKLLFSFIDGNPFLHTLPGNEKHKILIHLVSNMHAIESSYLSWRFGEQKQDDYWVMSNKVYLNMSSVHKYCDFNSNACKGLKINQQTTIRLLQTAFSCLAKVVKELVSNVNPAYDELLFLIGLQLYNPKIQNLSFDTRRRLQQYRNYVIDEMAITYKKMRLNADDRIKNLIVVSEGLEDYAHRVREDMLLFRCFNIVSTSDAFLNEIWDINVDL